MWLVRWLLIAAVAGAAGDGAGRDRGLHQVVIVPERFRIKISSEWGNLHIDHAPLPDRIDRALAQDTLAAADATAPMAAAAAAAGTSNKRARLSHV